MISAVPTPSDLLEQTLCANERQGALLEAIGDKLDVVLHEMKPGEQRDREVYHCWMLLATAQENHACIDRRFHNAHEGLLAERLQRGAAA